MPEQGVAAASFSAAGHWPAVCVWALMFAAVGLARAQAVESASEYLARVDADGDGRVAISEYLAWMRHGFDAMDHNRDGLLVGVELPGGRGGAVSRATHQRRLADRFRRQDRNADGWLDAGELTAPPRWP